MPRDDTDRYKRNAAIVAFIVTLAVVLLIYSDPLYSKMKDAFNPDFILNMNKVEDIHRSENYDYVHNEGYYEGFNYLMRFKEEDFFVPDYKVNTNILIKKKLFEEVIFSIQFMDVGIEKLNSDTWYFNIVITNNDQIKAIFPGDTLYSYDEKWYLHTRGDKFYENALELTQNGTKYYIPQDILKRGCGKYVYVYRNKLHWEENEHEIFYRFIPDEIGEWNIFILIFDEKYKDRRGKEIDRENMGEFEDNAVEIEKVIVEIQEKNVQRTSKRESLLKFLGVVSIITSVIFGSIYKLLTKKQEFFIRFYDTIRSNKEAFLLLIVVLILVVFLNYYIH